MTSPPAVHHGSESWPAGSPAPIVTIGNFDGVHLGHQALIARARDMAGPDGQVVVLTFDPPPRKVLRDEHVQGLQSLSDRIESLGQAGADHVIVEPFTRAYAARTAAEFARDILGERLHAKGAAVGWDFRFGRDRGGEALALRTTLGIPVEQVGGILYAEQVVSSTRIRQAITTGDLTLAQAMLGRPHMVCGRIVHGDARGRTLGMPTANLMPDDVLLPPFGVYAVQARLEPNGPWWPAVANLGVRPQFGPTQAPLEVHILDRDTGDIYGQTLRVAWRSRLREERAFASVEAMMAQIARDIEAARQFFDANPWS